MGESRLKTVYAKLLEVRYLLGATWLILVASWYGFQFIYPSVSHLLDIATIRTLGLVHIALLILTLLIPLFVIDQSRRWLALAGLPLVFLVVALIRWLAGVLFEFDSYDGLSVFILGYMYFTPTYALIFLLGWAVSGPANTATKP